MKYVPIDLHFAMIFISDCSFINVNYCTAINHDLNPKDMNPNCYTNPGKGGIGNICLTHVTLSSCKTGNPPPPPPTHTHTHTLCIKTDQHLVHKLSIYCTGIIIFPKQVLIQICRLASGWRWRGRDLGPNCGTCRSVPQQSEKWGLWSKSSMKLQGSTACSSMQMWSSGAGSNMKWGVSGADL